MATSTLRTAIIVALLVGGVVVLTQVFPEAQQTGVAGGASPTPTAEPTESPSPTPSPEGEDEVDCSEISGVAVAFFNGTSETGLAASWHDQVEAAGDWVLPQLPADAPASVEQTIVYFRARADRPAAECFRDEFFPESNVRRLPQEATNVQGNVRIAVYLGPDAA